MSLNVEEPYKEEEVLYQVQVRLNSRGRERVLKVKVYDCARFTFALTQAFRSGEGFYLRRWVEDTLGKLWKTSRLPLRL